MAVRAAFEKNNEIGCFAKLTNTYCLVAIGGSENFYSVFEGELSETIPVVHASIAGCRIIGRMCVGEKSSRPPGSQQHDRPGAAAHQKLPPRHREDPESRGEAVRAW
uniref:Eukaryotic translation initiation factor 6-like n=1 Tax=Pundamilia nyererei TaxID=303518 RepID=A0A3B4F5K9_9CICH